MNIEHLTTKQLLKLRKEIVLNSLFLDDYKNSFDIDENECFAFFDGYLDYLYEIDGDSNADITNVVAKYDNKRNLKEWRMIYEVGLYHRPQEIRI